MKLKNNKKEIINRMRKIREELWEKKFAKPLRFEKKARRKMTTKRNAQKALKHFEKLREMIARRPSPFKGMSEEEVIKEMRKTREEVWREKFAISS